MSMHSTDATSTDDALRPRSERRSLDLERSLDLRECINRLNITIVQIFYESEATAGQTGIERFLKKLRSL